MGISRRSITTSKNGLPDEVTASDRLLAELGERVRRLRTRHRLTRKSLAQKAGVSERYLAALECGSGNASILFLQTLAGPLQCTLADIIVGGAVVSSEWKTMSALLEGRSASEVRRACFVLEQIFSSTSCDPHRFSRIALVGLRGAGKSTLGRMLADELKIPFIELSRVIEQLAGSPLSEIYALYGSRAYRRYESHALTAVISEHPNAVIAVPSDLVGQASTYSDLLAHCLTIWLQVTPEEQIHRIRNRGDFRPPSDRDEAFADLQQILENRRSLYGRANLAFNTSNTTLAQCYLSLRDLVKNI